jgi:hypothetical protein
MRASAVVAPLDRPYPVVLRGTSAGVTGSIEILCSGSTEIASANTLRAYAGLILIETAFGDVVYGSVTKAAWKRKGTLAAPRRLLSLSYTETGCDLDTVSV